MLPRCGRRAELDRLYAMMCG
eukprot:SAG31_NODE_43194_length_268_cov_0.609467_1_plen_20_part_10